MIHHYAHLSTEGSLLRLTLYTRRWVGGEGDRQTDGQTDKMQFQCFKNIRIFAFFSRFDVDRQS